MPAEIKRTLLRIQALDMWHLFKGISDQCLYIAYRVKNSRNVTRCERGGCSSLDIREIRYVLVDDIRAM